MSRSQDLGFTVVSTMVDRPDGMDHVARLQSKSRGDPRLAGWAAADGTAGAYELGACRAMDGTVDAAAAEQGAIRRIHDRIYVLLHDVALGESQGCPTD